MASLPPRHSSQQRPTSRDHESTSAASSRPLPRADSEAISTISEDSQTLLLNHQASSTASSTTSKASKSEEPQSRPKQPIDDEDEPRKCWICFNDETEDTPTSSQWRSPCPCALTAHESCLLDWIADMEAPNSRRRAGAPAKILCPQCKTEIRLARPRSFVVDGVRTLEKFTGMFLLPGIGFVLVSSLWTAATLHGVSTIYLVFGAQDGYRILQPIYEPTPIGGASVVLSGLAKKFRHWRLYTGLGLLPGVLIASRGTIIDSILPILPFVFFATSSRSDNILTMDWPPSAALSMALLPYFRGMYNTYYEKVWAPRERQWLREIQPRAGENGEENDRNRDDFDLDENEDILEINVDVNIIEEWGNRNEPDEPPQPLEDRGLAPPLHQPPLDDDDIEPPLINAQAIADHVEAQQQANAAPPAARPRHNQGIGFSTTRLAETVLGALVFPSVAAAVGEFLRLVLPRSWTVPPSVGRPTGLLQLRWGRSILGGCLFVTVKDAIMLYVRWKMAQNHRKRRVLDYDKSKANKARSRPVK